MKHINLYQAAFHPPKTPLPARKLLAGGVVFLCGLLAVYAWDALRLAQLRQEVGQLTQRASHLETQVNAGNVVRRADPKVLAETESVEARLRNLQLAQEALASGALGSTTGYSAQFSALARARVPGAWLTRVEIAASGHELNLRGRALTGEDSARLIASLRREPLFVGLSFAGLTLEPPEDKSKDAETTAAVPRFLEFALSAQLNPARPGTAAAISGAPLAQRPDPAALAALAARAAAGKLDVNQAMRAAAAGKMP
ncbi:MAG: PilN domain-containing protein [Gallionellaceae bacterium]|nr:PilN domain-containing protein [Gallionellaceae bacterium]